MKIVADLHVHSKYARATSKRMQVEDMAFWAERKGVNVLGTGDFTHPEWLQELKKELAPAEKGLFRKKEGVSGVRFLLTSEISCIFSKKGKVRKIHILVFAPSFKSVKKVNSCLDAIGNLRADGRPTLGLDAEKLVDMVFKACPNCFVVPAHIWTPWFSLFGSRSGFDSLKGCFGEHADKIHAVETGLSSDPPMNWRLSALDKLALISNSDAHSPEKIGREANVLESELSYSGVVEAVKSKDPRKFLYTIEFFPEEGKYHYDGHRKCGVFLSPEETEKYGGVCPVCGKELTVGVLNRVEELADREEGFRPQGSIPYKSLVPLAEILAEVLEVGADTKTVKREYNKLINVFENELFILLDASRKELEKVTLPEAAEGICRVREGKVKLKAGYDGVYGKIKIFNEDEGNSFTKQKSLF